MLRQLPMAAPCSVTNMCPMTHCGLRVWFEVTQPQTLNPTKRVPRALVQCLPPQLPCQGAHSSPRGQVRPSPPEGYAVRQLTAPSGTVEAHANGGRLAKDGDDAARDGPDSIANQQPCSYNGAKLCCALLVDCLPNVHDHTTQPEVNGLHSQHSTAHHSHVQQNTCCERPSHACSFTSIWVPLHFQSYFKKEGGSKSYTRMLSPFSGEETLVPNQITRPPQ
jgi:hypothetical protein